MSIIQVMIILIVIGVILFLVNKYIPMDANIKKILNAVVIVCVILWVLSLFFNFGSLGTIHTHKLN